MLVNCKILHHNSRVITAHFAGCNLKCYLRLARLLYLSGQQEDEEVTGGGAASTEGSGKGREAGVEEHE